MSSSFTTWAEIGLVWLLVACGGSTAENPQSSGSGGSAGSSGTPDGGSVGTTTGPGTGVTSGAPGTTTVAGTGGTGGAGGGTGGAAGAGGSKMSNAIALLDSQLPANQDSKSWLDMGEALEPTTLLVGVSTGSLSCAPPDFHFRRSGGAGLDAFILVGLPASMQKPGTYQFSSTDVIAWGGYWLGDGRGSGGGTTGTVLKQGSVEVVSIGADTVDVSFSDLGTYYDVLEGPHTAMRCH